MSPTKCSELVREERKKGRKEERKKERKKERKACLVNGSIFAN